MDIRTLERDGNTILRSKAVCFGLVFLASTLIFLASSPLAHAGVGYALDRVSGFHSYGSNQSVGGFDNSGNHTDSPGGSPAPLACAVNGQNSNRACMNAGGSSKWMDFGVFSVYESDDPNDGGTKIMNVQDTSGGGDDGWRYFWQAPTLTGAEKDGFTIEHFFQMFHTKDTNGENAKDTSMSSNRLFNGKWWNISKAEMGEATGANRGLKSLYNKYSMKSPGNSTITVNKNEVVRLEWACQPYQVQYFQADCENGSDNCTVGKMLRLFDGAELSGLPSGNGSTAANSSRNISATVDATYSLRCVSSGTSGSWNGDYVVAKLGGNTTAKKSTGTWNVAKREGPWMSFNIRVMGVTLYTRYLSGGAWTAATTNDITTGPGDRVQVYYTATNATSCSSPDFATGGATSGWFEVTEPTPGSYKNYTVNCVGAGGVSDSDSSRVTVNDYPTPTVSCSASPTAVKTSIGVEWRAVASGGAGTYIYDWEGSESLSGSTAIVSKAYSDPGTKTGRVKVTASGKSSAWTACSKSVVVTCPSTHTLQGNKCVWKSPSARLYVRSTTAGIGWTQNDIIIESGDDIDLEWESENAVRCDGVETFSTGGALNGTQLNVVAPASGKQIKYEVECENGNTPPQTGRADVVVRTIGDVSLTADRRNVRQGDTVTLTWNTGFRAPDNCSLTGPGVNENPVATGAIYTGTEQVTITERSEYILLCSEEDGGEARATIEIVPTIFES